MAVRLADYSKKHERRIRFIWLVMIAFTTISFALMTYLATGSISLSVLLATPVFVLQMVTLIIVLPTAMVPVDTLSRAITHVSGQISDVIPPNVNGTIHEKTGLKDMLDVIYKLATNARPIGEEKADEAKERIMLSLLEDLPFGVVGFDNEGRIIYFNHAAPVVVNEKNERHLKLMFDNNDTLDLWHQKVVDHSITESKQWRHVQTAIPGEAGRKVFDVFAQYNGNDASGIETILITIDHTESYARGEEDVDFISLAAHELRGPVTVIHGYLDVLQDELKGKLQPDQVELFERLKVSAARLTGYINNILNVAKYDRRHLQLSLQEERLGDIYSIIDHDISLRASTQNRKLQVSIPADLPTVAADRASVSEVLANLIDNAIKYSHDGGLVTVSAAVDGDFVKCSVQDRGIGMPAMVVNGLFKKFYRSHRSSQQVHGTGLGLYISKAIVDSHGGAMGVRSKEGEGSVFTFSLPIYSTVAEKLRNSNNSNQDIIRSGGGWIKNHAMYKG